MESHLPRLMGILGLVVGAGLVGCGSGDDLPRQKVSGKVTLGGEPLAEGRIQFEPSSPEAMITAGGEIKDGEFAIPRDQGPTPGDYRVMITSAGPRKTGAGAAPGDEKAPIPGPAPELVPKQYNAKTTLTAKVEADKSNTYEFPLNK